MVGIYRAKTVLDRFQRLSSLACFDRAVDGATKCLRGIRTGLGGRRSELYFSAPSASRMGAPPARRVTAWRAWRFPEAAPWGQTLPESIPKWVRKA